jgi:hypothetical protein
MVLSSPAYTGVCGKKIESIKFIICIKLKNVNESLVQTRTIEHFTTEIVFKIVK